MMAYSLEEDEIDSCTRFWSSCAIVCGDQTDLVFVPLRMANNRGYNVGV
jgi:hypothetical protein